MGVECSGNGVQALWILDALLNLLISLQKIAFFCRLSVDSSEENFEYDTIGILGCPQRDRFVDAKIRRSVDMASGAVIKLEPVEPVSAASASAPLDDGFALVRIDKGHDGLGFSIVGGSDDNHIPGDPSIFVSRVKIGGAAETHLQEGDRIVSVNGTLLEDLTHDEAVSILRGLQLGTCDIVVEHQAETRILKRPANYILTGSSAVKTPSTPSASDSPKNVPKSILKKPNSPMAATMTISSTDGSARLPSTHLSNDFTSEAVAKEIFKNNLTNAVLENFASSSSVFSDQESLYNGGFIHKHEEPDDEDKMSVSTVSVAPSTTSYYEEIRRVPAESSGILDPANPKTEVAVVLLGIAAITLATYGAYRYFSRR
ncbi:hypothetical protein QR680_005265 [Steinernema hermaphroditum]|uniref:PDZ domain-containing protein n=1 Tax=Steinernema hermaphroditum TaxID=289476 RepID=A0AA39LUI6_9BILA|nr:hypothetical protein QR680_005265 [Steinernema hermaphroditum]